MSTTRTRSRSPGAARARGPAFPVVEAKLSIPPTRAGVIPRDQLLRRLRAEGRPIVAVVAPPGYGKTTLLAQWAETSGRPVVWLTVDNRDNDPAVLLTYLAVGLDRVRPIDRTTFATLASPAAMLMAGAVPRLVAEMQGSDPRPLVILDDVHLLTETASMDVLTELAAALPPGSQLAIGGR